MVRSSYQCFALQLCAQRVGIPNEDLNEGGRSGRKLPRAPWVTMDIMQQLDCPKSLVGRVIGRGGSTINDLQNKSGTRIQIEQNVPEGTPCKVCITGPPQAVQLGIQMVMAVMAHGPVRTQQGGPPPGFSGFPQYGQVPQIQYHGSYPQGFGVPQGYGMQYGSYAQMHYGGYAPPGFAVSPGYGMQMGGMPGCVDHWRPAHPCKYAPRRVRISPQRAHHLSRGHVPVECQLL